MNKANTCPLRDYYVSQGVIDTLICGENSIDCYVETKKGCEIITLQSFIENTDSEVGRHDLAILYKRLYLKNHTFQLGLDFVDYGAGGVNYADETDEIKDSRNDLLKGNCVIIYGLDEKDDNNTIFFEVNVELDDIEEQQEIKSELPSTHLIDIELVKRQISNGDLIILPINKETNEYNGIFFERNSDLKLTFHKNYVPILYSKIERVLSDKVNVPKDFTLYEFFIMKKDIETDKLGNTWITLSYNCSLSSLDLIELDTTGKTHMYILDNFKDVDKNGIYESFMKLDKEKVSYDTMIRIIEKVHPTSTKWFEDLIIDRIKGNYISSENMNAIVKYIRVSKKSKDRDVAKFLNMMVDSYYIDGYVRILKALNLKDDELKKYVDTIIEKDKELEAMGSMVSSFVLFWNKTFKDIEDYLYLGMQTQDIHPPCSSSSLLYDDTEEKRNRKGLNTDHDFVKSYLRLLNAKNIDKVELIKRYMQGIEMDDSHFEYEKLLNSLHSYINSHDKNDLSNIVPLFVECIVKYDKYGEFAEKYLPEEKLKKISSYFFSYYIEEFKPYVDALFEVATVGRKRKNDEKWKL